MTFRTISALAALTALCGCSSTMVTSYPSGALPASNTEAAKGDVYGEYGLAKTIVVVTVSEAGGGAAAADDKKSDGVTVTNNVNVNVTTQKPAAPAAAGATQENADKAPENKAAWCKALRKTYNQDALAVLQFRQDYNAFAPQLVAWAGAGIGPKDPKDVVKEVETYFAKQTAVQVVQKRAEANFSLISDECPIRYKVEIKESVEVDSSRTYRLYGRPDVMSTDAFTGEFEGGYPKSITASADHQGTQIITSAVKTLVTFATTNTNPLIDTHNISAFDQKKVADAVAELKKGVTPGRLKALLPMLAKAESLTPIDQDLPFTRSYDLAALDGNRITLRQGIPLVLMSNCSATPSQSGPAASAPAEGVVVSAQRSCTLMVPATGEFATATAGVKDARTGAMIWTDPGFKPEVHLARLTFAATDSRYTYALPVERTALIKRSTTYAFANGRVTKTDVSRPAQAVQIIALPLTIVGAVTSTIADGIRGRKGEIEAKTEWTKAETAQIEAAVKLEKAKKDARKDSETPEVEETSGDTQ